MYIENMKYLRRPGYEYLSILINKKKLSFILNSLE